MSITINLSDTEYKSLQYVSVDPQDWIENLVKVRCHHAIEEIVKLTVEKCLENNIQIPNSKDEMVTLAFDQGWVQSAADLQEQQTETP